MAASSQPALHEVKHTYCFLVALPPKTVYSSVTSLPFLPTFALGLDTESSVSPAGPDPESWSSDLSMREADPRKRLGSSLCTDASIQESEGQGLEKEASEESGEEPTVQSDEEEVQLDSALVVLPEPLKTCESSDSDSQTSEPVTELPPG